MLQASTTTSDAAPGAVDRAFWLAPLPGLILDVDGRIIDANAAAERVLGRTTSELARLPFTDLADPIERADLALVLATAAIDGDHGRSGRNWTMVGPHGEVSQIAVHLAPNGDGTTIVQLVPGSSDRPAGATLRQQKAFRLALLELSELSHDVDDDTRFCATLLDRAIEVVPGAQSGSIMLRKPGTGEFEFVAAVGFDLAGLQTRTLREHEMFRDIDDPIASINRDLTTDGLEPEQAAWMRDVGRLHEIESNVSAPVIAQGETIAFVSLDNFEDREAFDATSVEMTTLLGRLIADLLRRRELEAMLRSERESYKHLAHHDELTGVANRRHLEAALFDAVETSRRYRTPLTVLFVDIDDFKQLNDQLGHDVGDLALVAVADALMRSVRSGDIVGRWGGDEFLIGARAWIVYASANRDERHYADPDQFDPERGATDHLGWGMGVHLCVGKHLSMLEMSALVRAIIRRVERIEIDTPTRLLNNGLQGFRELPMRLVPR